MNILHINSNFGYTDLHMQMLTHLTYGEDGHIVFFPVEKGRRVCGKWENVLTVPCFGKWDKLFFYKKQTKLLKALEEKINVEEYDILHAYTLFTDGNIAYKLNQKYHIPYVVAVRNTDVNYFLKYRKYLAGRGREIIRNASAVFFLSGEYEKQLYMKLFSEKERNILLKKTSVIPNGIADFWHENRQTGQKQMKKDVINLIYAGRINKDKNILQTAKAAETLQRRGRKVVFFVVGKVEDEQVLESLREYEFVHYMEARPKEELIKLYREIDIFIMPSKRETFGLVYPEAMSQGLPVIYTKGQGFDGQFPDGEVGYPVDCEDSEEIVEKILKIADNYKEISQRAVKGAEKFRWERICAEYREIYARLLKK